MTSPIIVEPPPVQDLDLQIQAAMLEIARDIKNVRTGLGDTGTLTTAGAASAVGALNDIESRLKVLELDPISRATVISLIGSAKTEIDGGASEAGNTLAKLEGLIGALDQRLIASENAINTLQSSVQTLVSGKASQADMEAAQAAIGALQTVAAKVDIAGDSVAQAITDSAVALKNELLGGAGSAFDTFQELADLINSNKSVIEALQEVAAGKVAFDREQSLSDEQKATARTNIGAAAASDVASIRTELGLRGTNYKNVYIAERDAV